MNIATSTIVAQSPNVSTDMSEEMRSELVREVNDFAAALGKAPGHIADARQLQLRHRELQQQLSDQRRVNIVNLALQQSIGIFGTAYGRKLIVDPLAARYGYKDLGTNPIAQFALDFMARVFSATDLYKRNVQ